MTNVCRKSLPGRVAPLATTKAAFETLKMRIIFVNVLPTPKSAQEAKFVVAMNASEVDIAGVLLQEDPKGQLRPCA